MANGSAASLPRCAAVMAWNVSLDSSMRPDVGEKDGSEENHQGNIRKATLFGPEDSPWLGPSARHLQDTRSPEAQGL